MEFNRTQNNIKYKYVKPTLKKLTQKQIDDIHARGKITPAEQVEEWEDMSLCAPGDDAGSASWRCKKFFNNCHDCLVDYANEHDEYLSFFKFIKTYGVPKLTKNELEMFKKYDLHKLLRKIKRIRKT